MTQSIPETGSLKSLEKLMIRSWWVVLFALLCLLFYEQMQKTRKELFTTLNGRLDELFEERRQALALKQDILSHLNSQNDPAYVELTLMKVLGVAPEGQIKIYFRKTSPNTHD